MLDTNLLSSEQFRHEDPESAWGSCQHESPILLFHPLALAEADPGERLLVVQNSVFDVFGVQNSVRRPKLGLHAMSTTVHVWPALIIGDVYEAWSVSKNNLQLCKQGLGSFIPGKKPWSFIPGNHELLLGRFLGKSLRGIAGYKTSISLFTNLHMFELNLSKGGDYHML